MLGLVMLTSCDGGQKLDDAATSPARDSPASCVETNTPAIPRDALPAEMAQRVPRDVGLWGEGSLYTVPVDASYQVSLFEGRYVVKLPWYRTRDGAITISGRREGGGGAFAGEASQGEGPVGFQPSGLDFSEPGCWEVTGRHADGSTISFHMWIPVEGNAP